MALIPTAVDFNYTEETYLEDCARELAWQCEHVSAADAGHDSAKPKDRLLRKFWLVFRRLRFVKSSSWSTRSSPPESIHKSEAMHQDGSLRILLDPTTNPPPPGIQQDVHSMQHIVIGRAQPEAHRDNGRYRSSLSSPLGHCQQPQLAAGYYRYNQGVPSTSNDLVNSQSQPRGSSSFASRCASPFAVHPLVCPLRHPLFVPSSHQLCSLTVALLSHFLPRSPALCLSLSCLLRLTASSSFEGLTLHVAGPNPSV